MPETKRVSWFVRLTFVIALLCLSVSAWAQGAGELTGVITDSSGAVVAKASVKVTNNSTGIQLSTVTTNAGVYRFPALTVVGTYNVTVEAPGYKTTTLKDITVSTGTTVNRDAVLQVGAKTETVVVEASAETVQTSESQMSELVNQRVWQEMPLDVRNQNEFIKLLPGVSTFGAGTGRGATVNGARSGTGNFMLEGSDNNDQGQGGRGQISDAQGGAATGISPEAIQEYRVITNSFSAEYGKAGGFVTDTVLKSGTNQWHGSIFEYNRIQALASNDYFSTRAGIQDHLVRNQFGASAGGPIIKDRTFFYSGFEIHRRRSSAPITTTSLTQDFVDFVKSGAYQQFQESDPNGMCQQTIGGPCAGAFSGSATTGTVFSALYKKGPFPLSTTHVPNAGETAAYYQSQNYYNQMTGSTVTYPVQMWGDLTVNDAYQLNEERYSTKIDHKISDKDSLAASFIYQKAHSVDSYGGGEASINPAYINDGMSGDWVLSWNHSFTPTVLNNAKFSYLRHRSDFPNPSGLDGAPEMLSWYDSLGVELGNDATMPQFFTDNQFQLQDSVAWVKGKHAFKVGGEYRRLRNGSSFDSYKNGQFYYNDTESMMTDGAFDFAAGPLLHIHNVYDVYGKVIDDAGGFYSATASVNPVTGQLPDYYRGYRSNEYAFYFQDDWKLAKNLTVNLGVRYEYFGPPHNFKSNTDSNFYFGSPVAISQTANSSNNPYMPRTNALAAMLNSGSFQVRNHDIWNPDNNNWAPRAGFAWDITGKQKLVLRGGMGITYDRIYNNIFENIRFNPPYFSNQTLGFSVNNVLGDQSLVTYPFTSNAAFANPMLKATPSARHMDQNLVTPYYEQFHLGVQYELAKSYILETEYVGTMGHKLLGLTDLNTFAGRTASGYDKNRINTSISSDGFRTNWWNSNYHALQVSLKKSFANGLQFNTHYTYSKIMDATSDVFVSKAGTYPTDTYNPKVDYGPGDFDVRHRWMTSFSYDVPFFKDNRWLGGWSTNGIIEMSTGTPFSIVGGTSTADYNHDGYATDRLPYGGTGSIRHTIQSGSPANGYFNKADWYVNAAGKFVPPSCPSNINNGQWCEIGAGRNSLYGPGAFNVDFGILKAFKVYDRSKLTFAANFFNLFNRTNFGNPVSSAASLTNFGKSTADAGGRQTQLSLRFDF